MAHGMAKYLFGPRVMCDFDIGWPVAPVPCPGPAVDVMLEGLRMHPRCREHGASMLIVRESA